MVFDVQCLWKGNPVNHRLLKPALEDVSELLYKEKNIKNISKKWIYGKDSKATNLDFKRYHVSSEREESVRQPKNNWRQVASLVAMFDSTLSIPSALMDALWHP